MEIAVELHPADAKRVGLRLRAGAGHHTDLTYDVRTGILELDRRQSGLTDFSPAFPLPTRVPLTLPAGVLRLRVIVDRCSIEVFANDGIVYLPALIFAPQDATGIQLLAEGGEPRLSALNLWALASEEGVIAWP
jgi:sucrose-6-phosphate hydrolase SacC (GH32 family)